MRRILIASLLSAVLYGCAGVPTKVADGVLTNEAGMTLYTFDKDAAGSGKSVCNGPCAKNWPPLMAAADASASGDYSIVTRDEGGKQWAYKGKPLYLARRAVAPTLLWYSRAHALDSPMRQLWSQRGLFA